jgi:cobaltochelatase CobS
MTETTPAIGGGKIECKLDGALCHSIQVYLRENHPGWDIARYQREYPGEPILSEAAKSMIRVKQAQKEQAKVVGGDRQPMHEIFALGEVKAAMNARGQPIMIPVMSELTPEAEQLVPDVDQNYVFDIENLKSILIAQELKAPLYVWGYHGTGKTTLLEQIAARTKRPFMRVQHTVNTEESHIIGQYVVKEGETKFELGPLAVAMLEGFVYCADEYDRGTAPVLSVYQPVLEGKALYIKEAPPAQRVIRPHPNFRFVATGNTNGCGDETGLYQGTQMQDGANFSRFGVTIEIGYMEPKVESMVIAGQANIDKKDADKLVEFANSIREAFKAARLGSTISPRELINAARFAVMKGGAWRAGLIAAWAARLSRVDKETADGFAQRVFGGV